MTRRLPRLRAAANGLVDALRSPSPRSSGDARSARARRSNAWFCRVCGSAFDRQRYTCAECGGTQIETDADVTAERGASP
ncbi:hypothetical protein [Halegenticoccus tardaugens]|uniref:hypothetical protein n=1 Tax=Halegenticoccus tardaugens TaxID=2071624 RepID=UPI00100A6FF0|nr:hypothetical protein [Halegenticoccus tardaugens]